MEEFGLFAVCADTKRPVSQLFEDVLFLVVVVVGCLLLSIFVQLLVCCEELLMSPTTTHKGSVA